MRQARALLLLFLVTCMASLIRPVTAAPVIGAFTGVGGFNVTIGTVSTITTGRVPVLAPNPAPNIPTVASALQVPAASLSGLAGGSPTFTHAAALYASVVTDGANQGVDYAFARTFANLFGNPTYRYFISIYNQTTASVVSVTSIPLTGQLVASTGTLVFSTAGSYIVGFGVVRNNPSFAIPALTTYGSTIYARLIPAPEVDPSMATLPFALTLVSLCLACDRRRRNKLEA